MSSRAAILPDLPPLPTQPFGEWLLAQRRARDWVGDLARAAAADPAFSTLWMPWQVMAHVRRLAADGDMAQAVDAAADQWFGGAGWALHALIEGDGPAMAGMQGPDRPAPANDSDQQGA